MRMIDRKAKLQQECGVTSISLANARILLRKYGEPKAIGFERCVNHDFVTHVIWPKGRVHKFTGFSWGYGGTGCRGLAIFIKSIGWEKVLSFDDIYELRVAPGQMHMLRRPVRMWGSSEG